MISIKVATFAIVLLFFAMEIAETQPIRNSDPIYTILCVRMRDESNTRSDFSTRMTYSLDSESDVLSWAETIFTIVWDFSKTEQTHKMTTIFTQTNKFFHPGYHSGIFIWANPK